MEKIDFINNQQPALNATNLNKLQQNVEDDIGDLTQLETSDRDNLVEAINEAKRSGGDAVPIHSIFDYDGDAVPSGYEQVNSYSTTEVKTGDTWIDGKPLYTKTINFGSLPNNTYKEVAHGVQNYDVIFVDFSASYTTLNNQQFQGLNSFALGLTTYINLGNIVCSTNGDRTSWVAVVTIKYTKTTD